MTVLLVLLFLGGNQKPQLEPRDGFLMISLPDSLWREPGLERRLFSGLTTTITLDADIEGKTHRALFSIRYDVWEEKVLVDAITADGQPQALRFDGLEALYAYLARGIPLAPWAEGSSAGPFQVVCRVIPYSAAEARATREWFSQMLGVPRAGERGLVGGEGSGGNDASGVFEVLMGSSIKSRAVISRRWRWRGLP